MATAGFTIVLVVDGVRRKMCKLLLHDDGSYFLTVPYHPSGKVLLARMRVNYPHPEKNRIEPPVDFALLDDDEHRLKLSHHPDGFVQFSGKGILSGVHSDGTPKGMGLRSWPIAKPPAGPAIGITILGANAFAEAGPARATDVEFRAEEMVRNPWDTGYLIEFYYMPRMWTRFLTPTENGGHRIQRQHPTGTVLDLRACWNPGSIGGLVGVEMYPAPIALGGAESGFVYSSPTGDVHYDEDGDLVGEAIYASFPALDPTWSQTPIDLVYSPLDDHNYSNRDK